MEINTNNLLDNIIFRANIFNYDSKFLSELKKRNIKLDFSIYSQGKLSFKILEKNSDEQTKSAIKFLNLKSKEQLNQIISLLGQKEEEQENSEATDEYQYEDDIENVNAYMNKNSKNMDRLSITSDNKIVRTAFTVLLDILLFSKSQLSNTEEKRMADIDEMEVSDLKTSGKKRQLFSENILFVLLYIDGLVMFNIDIIKKFEQYSPLVGINFSEFLFEMINCKFVDDYTKEIASHLLCLTMAFVNPESIAFSKWKDILNWSFDYYLSKKRENCLTANLSLILTYDDLVDYFVTKFESEKRCIQEIFNLMIKENNYNTIYESLFVIWNLSNNKNTINIFENKNDKYLEKIVQVIKTNKIDKIARIGLMIIKNLLDSQVCLEILLDIKFMRTIDILLTNKWNDPIIKEQLNFIYDFLEKNYKIMNSFEKFTKEIDSGNLKWGSLHTTAFWEDNYKDFEFNNFDYIRKLVCILQSVNNLTDHDIEMKCIACFDLGEFVRLYPGGASILDHFGAKDHLMFLITQNNMELKNRALVCLQKIMMRSLKK